jgi:hypothetical protein
MSELGYKRWRYYCTSGAWPKRVEVDYISTDGLNDPDTLTILYSLASLVKRNPLAREYVTQWEIDRWGSDWHDQYTGQRIYRRQDKKLLLAAYDVLQTHATRRLDDALLFQLLKKWDEFRSNERDYDKASKRWFEWWDAQK